MTSNEVIGDDAPSQLNQEQILQLLDDHPHQGCPANSSCSKKMGKKQQAWLERLKSINQKKDSPDQNVRVNVWLLPKDHLPLSLEGEQFPNFITWTSHCPYHRLKDQDNPQPLIHKGQAFISHMDELKNKQGDFFVVKNRAYLLRNSKEVIKYQVPTYDLPLKISNESLVYLLHDQEYYYSLSVDPKGSLSLLSGQQTDHFPKNIECPKILKEVFHEDLEISQLFQEIYCRNVWSESDKKYYPMIFGWTCGQ